MENQVPKTEKESNGKTDRREAKKQEGKAMGNRKLKKSRFIDPYQHRPIWGEQPNSRHAIKPT